MSKKQDILKKYTELNKRKKLGFEKLVDSDKTPTTKYADYMCRLWLSKADNENYTTSMLVKLVNEFESHIAYIENKDIYSKEYLFYHQARTIVDKAIQNKEDATFEKDKHVKVL